MKKFVNPYLSMTMAVLILFVSCTQYDEDVSQKAISEEANDLMKRGANYTGEDIFRGIFFLEGKFVNEIPSLYNAKVERDIIIENPMFVSSYPELSEQYLNQEAGLENDSLVLKIRELNPNIFTELKSSILSKDPYKVKDKLEDCALLLKSALLTNEKVEKNIKVIKDGKNRGGIDPKNYDFTVKEDVERYNSDMTSFLENDPEYSSEMQNETAALAIVFLVTFFVLVAFIAYLLAAIGGDAVVFIGNFLWIYNVNWVENWSIGDIWDGMTNVISDVIDFF
jgi:SdpC family antimicrobial peptide